MNQPTVQFTMQSAPLLGDVVQFRSPIAVDLNPHCASHPASPGHPARAALREVTFGHP